LAVVGQAMEPMLLVHQVVEQAQQLLDGLLLRQLALLVQVVQAEIMVLLLHKMHLMVQHLFMVQLLLLEAGVAMSLVVFL
jgi:hypothetical protein